MDKDTFSIPDNAEIFDISIPLRFEGEQPNVYGVRPATSKPCEFGDLSGDTRQGGPVNFEEYTIVPHCNGTHTECVGHITDERISVRDCLNDVLTDALLITINPENALQTGESYPYDLETTDEFISRQALNKAISQVSNFESDHFSPNPRHSSQTDSRSLIIRSLPNDDSKLKCSYDRSVPPFFSNEGMEFIVESGFRHLLVDLPSIDRLYDDGKLSNHRLFWKVRPGAKIIDPHTRVGSTITELIYVPDTIVDGRYLLNLQIAPFESDAAPSRPVLISL